MKYIEKAIEDANTGANANYHEITTLNIDYTNNSVSVVLASYVSQKMKAAGKSALSFVPLSLSPLPSREVSVHDWALNQLIQAVPEGFVPQEYQGYINPHTFAGGKVKEVTTTASA